MPASGQGKPARVERVDDVLVAATAGWAGSTVIGTLFEPYTKAVATWLVWPNTAVPAPFVGGLPFGDPHW